MANNTKALKSGLWYTASNFLLKSIGFITTPMFSRMMSKADYGSYNNYSSWLSTIMIVVTLNLGATFISARFDFKDDFEGYISSSLALSSLATVIGAVILNLFHGFFSNWMEIEYRYLNVMMVYLLFNTAIDMFQTRERYYYEYKVSVALGLSISIISSALAALFILLCEDNLFGRIVGSSIPIILIGLVLYIKIFKMGKKVKVSYWKYALPLAVPFIPHCLSLTLLNVLDKMMITKFCGSGKNALYSIAYTCGAIVTLFITSLNTAFSPWLGEKLDEEKYDDIKAFSRKYVLIFAFLASGAMLVSPEVLLVMGGKKYMSAIYVMPPVAMGCVCQFMYTMYVNIEQFKKHTIGMAIASCSAAVLNLVLNYIFIPKYGYIAAAYTTLVCFLWLFIAHVLLVKKLGFSMVYDNIFIFFIVVVMGIYTIFVNYIYKMTVLRYIIVGCYIIAFCVVVYVNRNIIMKFFGYRNKKEDN